MSALPLIVLISLTIFTWAVAIWASLPEQDEPQEKENEKEREDRETETTRRRKAA